MATRKILVLLYPKGSRLLEVAVSFNVLKHLCHRQRLDRDFYNSRQWDTRPLAAIGLAATRQLSDLRPRKEKLQKTT